MKNVVPQAGTKLRTLKKANEVGIVRATATATTVEADAHPAEVNPHPCCSDLAEMCGRMGRYRDQRDS